jgi:D-amino-acid dehydrogenase
MAKKIAIIGGGVVGLCSAWYLHREGFDVEVFDQTDGNNNCSFGNAGLVVPSHFIPLAAPGMISQGMRWLFNPESPFYVKPRLNAELMRWGWLFYKNSTAKHVSSSAKPLADLNTFSKRLFDEIATSGLNFGLEHKGMTLLFKTEKTAEEELEVAEKARELGLEAKALSAEEAQAMEPNVQLDVKGGVYYPGDAHLTPKLFMKTLRAELEKAGVVMHWNTEITGFKTNGASIQALQSTSGEFPCDELVVAGGSWSGQVAKQLKLRLPLQAGKGYSLTASNVEKQLAVPSVLVEAAVAVTPMGNDLRFAGTMEIAGINNNINQRRLNGIVNSVNNYFPEMDRESVANGSVWSGLRPVSPDGIPYIGRSGKWNNMVVATGHAMMGLSLGPATGKLVSEMISGKAASQNLAPFNPDRFA